jgi:hypothetical protein
MPAARWRVAVLWAGRRRYLAAGGPDGQPWRLAGADEALDWPHHQAVRMLWELRRAQAWRQEYAGAELVPVPPVDGPIWRHCPTCGRMAPLEPTGHLWLECGLCGDWLPLA